jgi:hypothetical protein
MLYNGVLFGSGSGQLVFTIATPMRPSNESWHIRHA